MILAPKIENRGSIETPGGQTVLAASYDKVYLASSTDPNLRGLLVEVQTGGDVNNLGEIIAERGNISLLGLAVNQHGLVRATTSATLNGSIRLEAQDRVGFAGGTDAAIPTATRTGVLTVGGQVEVLMDRNSPDERAPDSQLQPRSSIKLTGGRVNLEANARITAPSGSVEIKAVSDPSSPNSLRREPDSRLSLRISNGAVIDVSGTKDTVLSVASNVIEVEARGGELADSPRQRDGVLRSKTLRVDVRKGSPLLDISGALGNIQRTTRERLSSGGQVTLQSDGDLVAGSGSVIDISGGQVTFSGDQVSTTRLVTDDGKIIDISEADPNRRYLGVLGDIEVRHDKWGIVETFKSNAFSRYETGYVEGRDAGTLSINSPRLAFDSEVRAGSVSGIHQRLSTEVLADAVRRPFDQRPFGGGIDVLLRNNETDFLPSIIITSDARLNPLSDAGAAVYPIAPVMLSAAMLNSSRLGKITLEAPGEIRIDAGGALYLTPDANLKLDAGRIVFNDDVRSPGGQIKATANEIFAVPVEDVAIDVAAGVELNTSGLWTNDNPLLVNNEALEPVVINAGSIELDSNGALRLASGSRLNAGAGAWQEADGTLHGGDGGDVLLAASSDNGLLPVELKLDGGLSARGFGSNGKFNLTANGFNFDENGIGSGATVPFDSFGSYNFTSTREGITVAKGSQIKLQQRNLQLTAQAFFQRSGELIPSEVVLFPDWQRQPVNLALNSAGFSDQFRNRGVDIGTGASIIGDPGAKISLNSTTSVKVDGNIVAAGGDITLAIDSDKNVGYLTDQKIWLGDNAVLDVSGRYIARPSDLGLRIGQVLDAGIVRFEAQRGSIVTRPGSLIDVHGVAATLDLPSVARSPFEEQRFEPVRVAGRAGTVDMLAAESVLLQGRYDAQVVLPDTEGGRFSLRFDPSQRDQPTLDEEAAIPVDQRFPHTQRILHLVEYQDVLPDAEAPVASIDNGHAYVPAERLLDSGFTSLSLSSRPDRKARKLQTTESLASIRFDRELNLIAGRALILDAPLYENIGVDVRLSAPYIAIGSRFDIPTDDAIPQSEITKGTNQPIMLNPSQDDGLLAITASQVDIIGHSVWQGFGVGGERTGLDIVSRGDIRLRGELMRGDTTLRLTGLSGSLRTAGDVRLSAQQIYPSTLSRFDFRVENSDTGLIRIDRTSGSPGQALSAGGRLTFTASLIEQAGVLRAPFGEVQLEASKRIDLLPGSLTSVSGAGLTVPFGQLQFQTDLTFLLGDKTELPVAPPTRLIRLVAPAIDLTQGAQLDVSGGGDARAWEFVPGPGGSRDILDGTVANSSFAILPSLRSEFAPWDPLESGQAEIIQGLRVGDTLRLEGGAGLAAGEYAILPARYALYGGYLITPVAGTQDLVPGSLTRRADGAQIFAGYRGVAGTDLIESRSQGYAIENGNQVRLRAEYVEKNLGTLFPNAVTGVADAGRLSIEAAQALNLGAELLPNRAGGRGAQVDIAAESLRVVQQRKNVGIELTTNELSSLGAESLLLGGLREDVGDTFQVTVTAQQLVVEGGVELALPELILVAHDLQIGEGGQTTLRNTGPILAAGSDLDIRGDAAVLAVSSRRGLQARRSVIPGMPSATLTIAKETSLFAENGGLILDSTTDLNLLGVFTALNGSLQLGSSGASLGETDGLGLTGLVLNNTTLAGLQGTDLILRSSRQIDVYGALEDNTGNPIRFGRINLDAPGLVGRAPGGRTMVLSGDQIELSNFGDQTVITDIPGTGSLLLQTESLTLDGQIDGAGFTLAGFDNQQLFARDGLYFQGGGLLNVSGDLSVDTPLITAASGTQGGLDVTGRLLLQGEDNANQAISSPAGLAARLDLNADSIMVATSIALPSGTLSLASSGIDGITLLTGTDLDVSGRNERFDTTVLGTPGGEIRLQALFGDVRLEGGRLDVSATSVGGYGGRVFIEAKNGDLRTGDVSIKGSGSADGDGASYSVDVRGIRTLGGTDGDVLTPLLSILTIGDFNLEQKVRIRQGDLRLQQDERIAAQHVVLSVDQGNLAIAGNIDASGVDGGTIELAAGDTLAISGVLDASAVDGEAGHIELVALDADADGQVSLDVGPQARLELNGGGLLQLYVPAGTGGVLTGLQSFQGTVSGAATREVLGVSVLKNPGLNATTGDSTLTSAAIAAELTAMDDFWQAAQGNLPMGFRLRPVLDVRADNNLRLSEDINLADKRFGPDSLPGVLMLRAGGDLTFDGSLNDGVFDEEPPQAIAAFVRNAPQNTRISSTEGWSYLISGGSDLNSADRTAVNDTGGVTLNNGYRVRTGTGDIHVVSGGDVKLGEGSAIYTFGRAAGAGAFADVLFPQFGLNGNDILYLFSGSMQFGQDGGDVRITARGDVNGAGVTGLNQDWQPKIGGNYNAALPGIGELPVIRGLSVNKFDGGIGVLGGGRMQVSAGRDVSDLSLVMPGTVTPVENLGVISTSTDTRIEQRADTRSLLSGGSLLQVRAGRDFSNFYLQADQGKVRVLAGRDITPGDSDKAILLGIGNSDVALIAGDRLQIDSAFDPGLIAQRDTQFAMLLGLNPNLNGVGTLFLSQSTNARLSMTSLAGDAVYGATTTPTLDSLIETTSNIIGVKTSTLLRENIVPARFELQAIEGSARIGTAKLASLPAEDGYLRILAGDSVVLNGSLALAQSDADPSILPDVRFPLVLGSGQLVEALATSTSPRFHALTPIHLNSKQFNQIVARNGDIRRTGNERAKSTLVFSNQTRLVAGRDILGLNVNIQHNNAQQISLVSAGRDIRQATLRESTGQLTGNDVRVYTIAGPGQLQFRAGRSIDLGASSGIESIGDAANTVLPDEGASISVLAGYVGDPDYAVFMARYIDTDDIYLSALRDFLVSINVEAGSDAEMRAALRVIDPLQRNRFLGKILFNELKASGIEATDGAEPSGDYSRGFDAIRTLFPDPNPEGRLDIKLSKIFTLDGGDIDLLVPGGLINGGATSSTALTKTPDELGVVTGQAGDINAFVDGDFLVNQSRVFALNGDLLMWSSNGDIDAGRGSKTALASPAPKTRIDPKTGQTIVEFPPNISGSGLLGINGFLFAPRGKIDAGDAGIKATGNLTLGALAVVGAGNINVGGISVGVPVANSGGIAAGLTGVSNIASSATKLAEDSVTSLASVEDGVSQSNTLGLLRVEILGFGE